MAVHYTTFLFRGLRWRLLLNNARAEGEEPAGIFQCSQLVLLGWFANSVAWLRLGDAYRAYLYHEEGRAPFVRTVGTILTERLLDVATIVVLLAVSLPFLVSAGQGGAWTVAATAAAVLGALAFMLLFITATRGRGENLLQSLLAWLPSRISGWLLERYRQLRDGALLSMKRVPLAAAWGLLGWLAEVARFYLVAQALDIHLSPALIVFATVANSLLTLAPTPGGVGRGGGGPGRLAEATFRAGNADGGGPGAGGPVHQLPECYCRRSGAVPGAMGDQKEKPACYTQNIFPFQRRSVTPYAVHRQLLRPAGLGGAALPRIPSPPQRPEDAVGNIALPISPTGVAAGLP